MMCPECFYWSWLPDPDLVQHVSLPLELLGLFLAMLEIFFPKHADYVEATVDNARAWLTEYNFYDVLKGVAIETFKRENLAFLIYMVFISVVHVRLFLASLETTTSAVLMWLGFTATGIAAAVVGATTKNKLHHGISYIVASVCFIHLIIAMGVLLVLFTMTAFIIHFFDHFGKGKATGGIGITLGCIGLLGEAYQVCMLNDDVPTRLQYWSMIATLLILLGVIVFFVNRVVVRTGQK